ncbi:ATP-binding protein [Thermodesulfovibrio sp. 3462-1]|uniref:histidine kinase n=1 Tax=Thermodesulfovibrio obliviosus TaxID=3118332 RepID=A0AAU8GZA0_9BACT
MKENILKRIIRLLPDGVFVIDLSGKVLVWNRAMEELTGVKEGEIVGKGDFEYAIPFYGFRRPMPVDYVINPDLNYPENLNTKKETVEIETFVPKLYNGKGAWVRMSAHPIYDEACDIIGAVQIVRDITIRKNAEIELRKLFNIVEHSPVGVAVLEFSGKIIYCNESFLKYTQLKTAKGRNIFELFPQISLYEIHNSYLKEIKFEGKIFRLRGMRINEEDGYAIFLTDITTLRKYEEQIIISHKMESIRKLVSVYSHEIKNMLTGIKGFAQLALQTENIEQTRAYVEKLLSIVDSVSMSIKEILGFPREFGRNPEVLDLKDVIKNLVTFLKASLRENISLILDFEEKPLPCFADKTDIEKIITNLVLNAQDAMPEGGEIKIQAKTKQMPEKFISLIGIKELSTQYICLSIQDTGIGMDEETKEKIFDPFFTTKGEKGSGLGLTIVYHIVQMLKGFIFVESEPGKGTKFDIYLPLYS